MVQNLAMTKHIITVGALGRARVMSICPEALIFYFAENSRCFIATCNIDDDEEDYCKTGDLFCQHSDGVFFLTSMSKLKRSNFGSDKRFKEISPRLLPFLMSHSQDVDKKKATEAVLSGQLDGVSFSKDEEVLVAATKERTGNPKKDLKVEKIENIEERRILTKVSNIDIEDPTTVIGLISLSAISSF